MNSSTRLQNDEIAESEMNEQKSSLNEEMSEDELEGIAAGGMWTRGTSGDDVMFGGDGDDKIRGGDGEDVIFGGDGNDTLDGGFRDGANDVLMGGDGDDVANWGPTQDGSDTFIGGEGNDTLKLDLKGISESTVQAAFESGTLTLDIAGDPDFVPQFDSSGNLILPDGASGVITGPNGNTMTFSEVETIALY